MAEKLISYLGIDIGSSSIKIVELDNYKGTPRLVTYGFIEDVPEIKDLRSKEVQEKISKIIKKICEKSKTQSKKAVAALPNFSVFSSIINISSGLKRDEMGLEIKSQARKIFPLALEELYLDWKFLPGEEEKLREKKGNVKILITGAAKNLVKEYVDIIKAAGLDLFSLETENFALSRSLIGKEKGNIMIMDLGYSNTEISIIGNGIPVYNRSIEIGGVNFSNIIGTSLGLDFQSAERLKKDVGITYEEKASNGINGNGESKRQYSEVVNKMLNPILNEMNYTLRAFKEANPGQDVDKLVLCGGGANMKNIAQFFEDNFKKICYVGDPWSQIIYPLEMRAVLKELGSRFATAVGLGMHEIV